MSGNKSTAAPSFNDVWRVTVTGKKKEGLSEKEFARRYALHGKLAGPLVVKYNGISYRLHQIRGSHADELREKLGPELSSQLAVGDIDGVSTLVFPTAKDLAGFISDPEYGAKLVPDASEFGEVTSIQFSVGDELVVVDDGKFVL
ncbi:hypothetical protein TRIATDRAFT_48045 [Trichoderma atroviride IMI 206040]|uniref:EthD domain-containing protein n=1 Tax=Hypocrea atroviridis (strain ATCC 20476 / IMI 206040) TaxID=452589 RepID=G9PC14_HYPAI|nr:uncharacterized protein TRIATDRAFT_48045 [Trichoderma atroviride IMI 206040]EHK39396.1 hypothetical protein TRIATDRAFT_48045 [Trichoderma atroviride IMI 206040]